jgi:hypothetical protein
MDIYYPLIGVFLQGCLLVLAGLYFLRKERKEKPGKDAVLVDKIYAEVVRVERDLEKLRAQAPRSEKRAVR